MIDIRDLRQNPDTYKQSAKDRGMKVDLDSLLSLDAERTTLIGEVEALRAQLNIKGRPDAEQLKQLQEVKAKLEIAQKEFDRIDTHWQNELMSVPNLFSGDTPVGGEEDSVREDAWGEAEARDLKDHLTLAEANDWVDFERGAKVAGSKFYYAKGSLARLNMAIVQYAVNKAIKAGFTPVQVPHMVNSRAAAGAGFLPRGEERQIYKIEGEDLNLIATAEIPLVGYHADEIIDPAKLPLLYVGVSPCYRMEAGTYGKHSKGLFRTHQFEKVEMFVYCQPEDSEKWHQKILEIEKEILEELEIPYSVLRIASGDLGAPAFKKYDLEYWSPVDGEYREITSCSNCTDYQARRLNIRTRGADGKTLFPHILNGTAAVTSRVPVAILENHQDEDGVVHVPKALQPYYGGETL